MRSASPTCIWLEVQENAALLPLFLTGGHVAARPVRAGWRVRVGGFHGYSTVRDHSTRMVLCKCMQDMMYWLQGGFIAAEGAVSGNNTAATSLQLWF